MKIPISTIEYEHNHKASGKDLFLLICLFTLCVSVLTHLYESAHQTQGQVKTERATTLGISLKSEPLHAPEIGY